MGSARCCPRPGFPTPPVRHTPTLPRIRFMNAFSRMRSPVDSSNWSFPDRFLAAGIGTKYEDTRRDSTISSVIPSSSNRKCRPDSFYGYGELRIGFSMTICARAILIDCEPDSPAPESPRRYLPRLSVVPPRAPLVSHRGARNGT